MGMRMSGHRAAGEIRGMGRINYDSRARPSAPLSSIVPRIVRYFKPYTRGWLLILICIGAAAALNLLPPLLIREIIDVALPTRDGWLLVAAVGGYVLSGLLARLVGVAQASVNVRIGQGVMFDLRNELYRHLQKQSIRFFTESKTGELMSRVTNDVNGIEGVVAGTVVSVVTNVVSLVSVMVVIVGLHWQLALLSLVMLPFFILPTRRVGRIRQQLRRRTAEHQGMLASVMAETLSISGTLLMKAFARERYEAERFHARASELRELEIRQRMVGRWFFMVIGLFQSIGPALIYLYGGWLVIQGEISIGTVVAFVAYLRQLYGPVSELANVHVDTMTSLALFERLFGYLDLVPEIAEPANALVPPPAQGHYQVLSSQLLPRWSQSVAEMAAHAKSLISATYQPSPSLAGFSLVVDRVPQGIGKHDLFSGLLLPAGGDARRRSHSSRGGQSR